MNLAQQLVRLSLRGYKLVISPLLHALAGPFGGCRFTPTCSEYASEAVTRHGFCRGTWLAAGRVCRCHPWGGCGHDPVPLKVETCSASNQIFCRKQRGTPDLDSRSVVSFGR